MLTDATQRYFDAAGDLAAELGARVREVNPKAHTGVEEILQRGGFLQLNVAFGLAGVVDTRLVLVSPNGEQLTLISLE